MVKSGACGILLAVLLLISVGIFSLDYAYAENSEKNNNNFDTKKDELEQEKKQSKEIEEKDNQTKKEDDRESQKDNQTKKEDDRESQSQEKNKQVRDLDSKREKLEEKHIEKSKELEEKIRDLKQKYRGKLDAPSFSGAQQLSAKSERMQENLDTKSETMLEKMEEKSDELSLRTQKVLEKINQGKYMGEKITLSESSTKYELTFDYVNAHGIGDKSLNSVLTGNMTFTTFDSNKSNLKLELEKCDISVDDVPYQCGFGKAMTASSGQAGTRDSLVIIAFLEDDFVEEVHTTLKILLNADMPITQIEESTVSILGPQSKMSHLWFLDGNATLSKIATVPDDLQNLDNSENSEAEENNSEIPQDESTTADK